MDAVNARKRIDKELSEIKADVYRMSALASESLERAVYALKERDADAAKKVISDGDLTDALEEKIDARCLEFAARYQPLGEDLRAVVSMMHIAVDLERIGDYGENIAKAFLSVPDAPLLKPLIDIPRMVGIIKEMLGISMRAMDARDPEAVLRVFPMDDEVDDLDRQITRELLLMIMEKPERIERSFSLMGVSRTLERAGDHATNVAERVYYMYSGRTVKAGAYRRKEGSVDG